jgi:hypothetical protein
MEIRENDTYIRIDNKYIRDVENILTSEELTILALITMNLSCKGSCIFSITWLLDTLGYSRNNSRKVKDIKNILEELVNDGILKLYKNVLNDKENIININNIDRHDLLYCDIEDTTDFTLIYDREILELINIANKHKLDTYSLINFVLYIYSFIDNNEQDEDYKLCYPSFNKINEDIELSESTIIKYNNILQKYNIIRCDCAGYKETSKGKIKNSKMFYCRYQDKDKLINRINTYRIKEGFIKQNKLSKDKSNTRRSLTTIMNHLKEKVKNNTITEIESIRLELLQEEYEKLKYIEKEQTKPTNKN